MSYLDKAGVERLWQHIIAKTGNKADKITLEDGTILNLQDVYDAIQENGSTSGGEGNNSTIIGGSENAVATGDNSVVIGESGTAAGAAAIAGGTNNPDIIKNLTWTTSSTEPSELPPADAQGDASIAIGAGTTTYTTGSVAIGTGAKAGAKGFYWYDYVDTVRGSGDDILECDYDPWASQYWYITIDQNIKENGLVVFCYGPRYDEQGEYWIEDEYLKETWSLSTGYMDEEEGFVSTAGGGVITGNITDNVIFFSADNFTNLDTATKYYIGSGDGEAPVKSIEVARGKDVKVRLSLTQPRISYNPDEIGNLLEDGTWAQERTWSDEAQTLLEGWAPIEEMGGDTNFAVISFYGGIKYVNCSKVLEVLEDGYIVVDSLPDPWGGLEPYTTIQWDEYLIFVPLRPEAGLIEASLGSFAIGLETAASGMASFAQGYGSHAAGSYAVATGLSTEAGYAALSGGERSKAAGNFSMAMGLSATTTGKHSMALGHLTNANGESAIAMNSRTTANGKYSTAMGRNTIASGQSQLVIGKHNIDDVDSDYAFIIGMGSSTNKQNAFTVDWNGNGEFNNEVYASDFYSTAGRLISESELNWYNIIEAPYTENGSGSRAVILNGGTNNATAAQATVAGTGSTAGGKYSFAGGNGSSTLGDQTIAFGHQCVANGGSAVALGRKVKAYGNYSTAFGNNTVVVSNNQLVQGKYNLPDVERDEDGNMLDTEGNITQNFAEAIGLDTYAFIVGNGSGEDTYYDDGTFKKRNRSNAFTLDWQGNGIFSGSITMNGNQTLKTRTLTIEYDDGTASETIQMVVV